MAGRSERWMVSALVVLVLGSALRAQDPFDAGPRDGLYSLPRSQDEVAEWQDARQDLAEQRYAAAAERLHGLLLRGSNGVVPILGGANRWNGIRVAVIETLRSMPPAAKEVYEKLARREAGRIFTQAPSELSRAQLDLLARRFPTSSAGIRARLFMGDRALTAGDGVEAQIHYRAALDSIARDAAEPIERRLETAERLVQASESGGMRDEDELARSLTAVLPSADAGTWPSYGGGYDGRRPMTAPAGKQSSAHREQIRATGFEGNDFAMHAVGDLTGLYVNDGHSLWAIDPVGQRLAWRAQGPMVDSYEIEDARSAVNQNIVLSSTLSDDIVVAPLQVPLAIVGAQTNQRFRGQISIIQRIPVRRLFAFDRSTGRKLWAHWDHGKGAVTKAYSGHDACGVPLIHGDTVYCATHDQTGAIAYYLRAYDLHTGEEKWRRLICSSQLEVNMFGNAQQEFAAGPIAVHGGMVLGTTNLGVCYAVDAEDGDLRWISEYDVIPLPRTRLRDQRRRPVFFANNPIVVANGVMATTPLDSSEVIGIDVETGRRLWQLGYNEAGHTDVRWLLGAIDGEFILSGLGLIAVKARPSGSRPAARVVASDQSLGEQMFRTASVPRGGLTGDRIWFVGATGGLKILDKNGNRDPRMSDIQFAGRAGNLLLVDGVAALLRNGGIEVHADLEGLRRAAQRELRRAENDPAAILRLATLERAVARQSETDLTGDAGERLIRLYAKGLEAATERGLGAGSPVWQKLAEGQFELSFERATAAAKSPQRARRARELFVAARERAIRPEHWLRAQTRILELTEDPAAARTEWTRMAETHGNIIHEFPDVGIVPAGVHARWRLIEFLRTPAERISSCQTLMERSGTVLYAGRTLQDLASARIAAEIEAHGAEVYAAVEKRAAAALESAADDRNALRQLPLQFPHSAAARRATQRLLDLAVASGDMRSAARVFAEASRHGTPTAGQLRRLQRAAAKANNLPLAAELGRRLKSQHASEASDLPEDSGKTFGELPSIEVSKRARTQIALPETQLARLDPPNEQLTLEYHRVEVADGFDVAGDPPLVLGVDDTRVLAFDLSKTPKSLRDAKIEVDLISPITGPTILCGNVLVVVEEERVRGLDLQGASVLWTVDAAPNREFTNLGVRHGVLHLYSRLSPSNGDGGRLIAISARQGAVLFNCEFEDSRRGAEPIPSAGGLWLLTRRGEKAAEFRRLDPVLGTVEEVTPVDESALAFLEIGGSPGLERRLFLESVQTGFFADEKAIYLPVDTMHEDKPSRMVAVERGTGRELFRWKGLPGCLILRAGLHDGRVVIVERSRTRGRIVLLDGSGNTLKSRPLREYAIVQNWPKRPTVNAADEAPDALLITDNDPGLRLTCFPLERGAPAFEHTLEGLSRVMREPTLGDGFVMIPASKQPREQVLELIDSESLSGALPGGRKHLKLERGFPLLKVFPHGQWVAVETIFGIELFGPSAWRNR